MPRWLEAGTLESGTWSRTVEGTPQGSGISPLLANVFLHYALDLWFHQWRRRSATGRAIIVRYADDFILPIFRESRWSRLRVQGQTDLGPIPQLQYQLLYQKASRYYGNGRGHSLKRRKLPLRSLRQFSAII